MRRTWLRSLLAPKDRLLPGLGARLSTHPSLAASIFAGLRRIPLSGARNAAQRNVSQPIVRRLSTQFDVEVEGGVRLNVRTDDVLGRMLVTTGVWEPNVTAAWRHLLAPGDVCVDIGAHVGYYTLLASRIVGPGGHVYAFEPSPATCAALRHNVELNHASNVTVLNLAAGAEEGRARLTDPLPGNTATASIRRQPSGDPAGSGATTVEVRPVAAVLPPGLYERLRVVKIDVEGYEIEVLRGLEPLLDAVPRLPALIVEIHAQAEPGGPAFVAELCRRRGYAVSVVVKEGAEDRVSLARGRPRLRPLDPAELVVFEDDHYDLLLVPR